MSLNVTQSNNNLTLQVSQSNVKATLSVTQNINELHITAVQNNEVVKLQPIFNTVSTDYIETDPIFQASEASLFVVGDKDKLDDIEAGAEVNVQSDWNQINPLDDSYIKNKPTIPTVLTNHSELTLDDGTNPHGTTKSDVGLGNVDNTSDIDKPISTAIQSALDLKQDNLTNPITGTGTPNYLSKFTGSGTLGDSQIFDNGTNVGIGTTTPSSDNRLEVNGRTFISAGAEGGINIAPLVVRNTIPYQSPFNQYLQVWQNSSGNIISRLRADGSFTTAAGAHAASFTSTAPSSLSSIPFRSALSGNTGMYFPATKEVGFVTNGVERFRILATGEITIGTTTAGARLDVRAQGALATDIAFRVRNSTDTQNFLVVNGAGDVYNNGTSGISSNTFFGENVGRSATGQYNSAFGQNTLSVNTTGNYNSAFGVSALRRNTTAIFNSAFGLNSLYSNTTGSSNCAFGVGTLQSHIAGNHNSAFGINAGKYTSSGSNNEMSISSVFIGSNTRPLDTNQSNQIVIGESAIGLGSNSVVLGNSSITRTRLQGQVIMGSFASAPTGIEGAIYYDSTTKKHYGFDGTNWNALY